MGIIVLDRYVTNLIPVTAVVDLSAAGAGSKVIATVPPGETWEVERVAFENVTATTIVGLYAGIVSIATLKEAFPAGLRGIGDESSPIRFYATETLTIVVTGGAALGQVGINVQATSVIYMPRELPIAADNMAMSQHAGGDARVGAGGGTPPDEGWN